LSSRKDHVHPEVEGLAELIQDLVRRVGAKKSIGSKRG
jgi:hypothetical protein